MSSSGFSHGKHFTRLAKSSLASSTSSIGPPSANYALALYSYTADNSDELTFYKGSVIAILSKEDSDWWKGDLNGQIGLVPANYVQELDDLQSSITSTRCKLHHIQYVQCLYLLCPYMHVKICMNVQCTVACICM